MNVNITYRRKKRDLDTIFHLISIPAGLPVAHKTVHYGEAGVCRGRRVVTHVSAWLVSASWWPRPRIWPASDNQPRGLNSHPRPLSCSWVLAAFWNGKLLINRFKSQISGIQFTTGCFQTISLSGENKIINSFFYPKQRTPGRGERRRAEEENPNSLTVV